jgi:O-antigen/teichoic acid export membrane protein
MYSFSSWILFGQLINTIFNNIYIFIIGKYYSTTELGFYSKANGYSSMVVQKPYSAIRVVSFPVFSSIQTNKEELRIKMKKFLTTTLFFIVPIIAVLIVIANPLVYFILTEKWIPMVPFLQILLIISLFIPVQLMNSQLLTAKGKSKLVFRVTIIRNILRLISIIITLKYGITALLIGELIVTLFTIFEVSSVTKKQINYGAWEQLKDLWKLYASFIISITLGYFSTIVFDSRVLILLSGGMITFLGYFLVQYLINKNLLIENTKLIKSKIF